MNATNRTAIKYIVILYVAIVILSMMSKETYVADGSGRLDYHYVTGDYDITLSAVLVDSSIIALLKIWKTVNVIILMKVFLCPKWFKNNVNVYNKNNELNA